MVWGMISSKGGIALTQINGSMNSDKYITEILDKFVINNN